MEAQVFEELCGIARQRAGIALKAGKEALVEARIGKRLRALGLPDEKAYLKHLQQDSSGDELICFLDAISTNYTSFLREHDHFDQLTAWAKSDAVRSRSRLRIWCAAAATGEEPYTIAITLSEALERHDVDFKILATDISTKALHTAIAGCYPKRTIEPLPHALRNRYLLPIAGAGAEPTYEVCSAVKERIVFRRLNLSTPPFPMQGPLDVVFCRNVMIYFDQRTRQGLVSEIERLLRPGGILFTGHSETLTGIRTGLTVIKPSVYHKFHGKTAARRGTP